MPPCAAVVILVAAGANLVAKCALALFFGGMRFALPLIGTAILSMICGCDSEWADAGW